MIDGIIKADGTSRLMRANLPATYEEFKAQAAAGTLPLDVLFNADGWSQIPTFLNKANLLKDATAAVFGLGTNSAPDDVFLALSNALFNTSGKPTDINGNVIGVQIATGSYTGVGKRGASYANTLTFPFVPKIVLITCKSVVSNGQRATLIHGCTAAQVSDYIAYGITNVTWNDTTKSVSWYSQEGNENQAITAQMNQSGAQYLYVAIG